MCVCMHACVRVCARVYHVCVHARTYVRMCVYVPQLRMRRLSMSRLIQLSKESSAPTMPETNVRRDFSTVQASMKRKPIEKADVPHIKVDTNESRGGANPNVSVFVARGGGGGGRVNVRACMHVVGLSAAPFWRADM